MKEDYWRDDRFHQIVVVFPDEVTPSAEGGNQVRMPAVTFEEDPRQRNSMRLSVAGPAEEM